MSLYEKNELLFYLKKQDLWAKKGLSQNFLVDKEVLGRIVKAGEIKSDDLVIEIGPGVGTMTTVLVKKADKVIAIEKDRKFAQLLTRQYSCCRDRVTIINDDILKINLNRLIGSHQYKVVANIPYHITSKILELFLSSDKKPELIVFLVQKEVAERVCARPGAMSVLSLSVQLYGNPEIVGIVPASSFFPVPKVDSAILKINLYSQHVKINEKDFFRLLHIGFSSRRKTLINNLSAGYHIEKKKVFDILKQAGFLENTRAQELSIDDWKNLLEKFTNY